MSVGYTNHHFDTGFEMEVRIDCKNEWINFTLRKESYEVEDGTWVGIGIGGTEMNNTDFVVCKYLNSEATCLDSIGINHTVTDDTKSDITFYNHIFYDH